MFSFFFLGSKNLNFKGNIFYSFVLVTFEDKSEERYFEMYSFNLKIKNAVRCNSKKEDGDCDSR